MRKFRYDKLVRDKVADKIASTGGLVRQFKLSKKHLAHELSQKLVEESSEVESCVKGGGIAKEIADVYEVLEALCQLHGITGEEIEKHREVKNNLNGAFKNGVYIESIEIQNDDSWVQYFLDNSERYPEVL